MLMFARKSGLFLCALSVYLRFRVRLTNAGVTDFPGLMMAKNHPSSLLGLGEEKGLGVVGLHRGGFTLGFGAAWVGNGAACQLLQLQSRSQSLPALLQGRSRGISALRGCSGTKTGSNSGGDTGKHGQPARVPQGLPHEGVTRVMPIQQSQGNAEAGAAKPIFLRCSS